MYERIANRVGGIDQAMRECMDRERWSLVVAFHLWDILRGIKASETIDREIGKNKIAVKYINNFQCYLGT